MTLADLPFPFHCVTNTAHLQAIDTTFSYQVWMNDGSARAICNDISCKMCPFPCKEGENRQEVLISFAQDQFPKFMV